MLAAMSVLYCLNVENLPCQGEFLDEQAHFCHYDVEERPHCPPSPILLNNGTNLTVGDGSDFCSCLFRGGKRICLTREILRNIVVTTITCIYADTEPNGVNPAVVLHIASILILTTFMGEVTHTVTTHHCII